MRLKSSLILQSQQAFGSCPRIFFLTLRVWLGIIKHEEGKFRHEGGSQPINLFYEQYAASARDSEKTLNPDITEVKGIVNGIKVNE